MKTQPKPRHQDASFISGGDLDPSGFWFGDLNSFGAFPTAPTVYQKPRANVFYMTRNWFERQVFIKAITLLKFDIFNYGFRLQAAKPGPDSTWSKKDGKDWQKKNAEVQAWHQENELAVSKFVRDVWQEWLVQDNCVAVWCKNCPPVIHPIEHLTYDDNFGIEDIAFTHQMTPAAVAAMRGLSVDEKKVMNETKKISVQKQGKATSSRVFFFEAVKRTRVGVGLAWPQLRTLFNSFGTWEGLELADWQLADALRTVYELHLIGHEIKNGNRAGMPDHFLKGKRAAAINKIIKNDKKLQAAIKKLVVNFDHKIEYPRPDPKHFGKERYEAVLERFMLWAMPIAQMLFAKQVNPWHGQFLQAKANTERNSYIGPFLNTVLEHSLGAPKGTRAVWSDDIFIDPRLMLDTLKTGLASGPLSQETFLEKSKVSDAHTERQRKDGENELDEHIVKPAFDAAHGDEKPAGHPKGQANKK